MRARFLSAFSEQQIPVRRQHTEYNRLYLKLNLNTLPKIIYNWSWLLITDIGDPSLRFYIHMQQRQQWNADEFRFRVEN